MTVKTVTIANCEEMKTLDRAQVRGQDETILILLVRISWYETYSGRKGKFCYHIEPLGSLVFL
jgi:hypothetical protein